METVLKAGKKYGLKVIVDLHDSAGKNILSSREGNAFLVEFWTGIAKKFRGHPALYGYDLLNEPHNRYWKKGLPLWTELAERVIAAVRKIDPLVPLIVECEGMATPDRIEFLPVFPFVNIFYSIHVYNPGVVTHQLNRKSPAFTAYDRKNWKRENTFVSFTAKAREFQEKTGARIFVGEFGCVRWAPGAALWLEDCISLFKEYQWDWCYHAFREWDGWSVEHSDDPKCGLAPQETARKRILLQAFRKNSNP